MGCEAEAVPVTLQRAFTVFLVGENEDKTFLAQLARPVQEKLLTTLCGKSEKGSCGVFMTLQTGMKPTTKRFGPSLEPKTYELKASEVTISNVSTHRHTKEIVFQGAVWWIL